MKGKNSRILYHHHVGIADVGAEILAGHERHELAMLDALVNPAARRIPHNHALAAASPCRRVRCIIRRRHGRRRCLASRGIIASPSDDGEVALRNHVHSSGCRQRITRRVTEETVGTATNRDEEPAIRQSTEQSVSPHASVFACLCGADLRGSRHARAHQTSSSCGRSRHQRTFSSSQTPGSAPREMESVIAVATAWVQQRKQQSARHVPQEQGEEVLKRRQTRRQMPNHPRSLLRRRS